MEGGGVMRLPLSVIGLVMLVSISSDARIQQVISIKAGSTTRVSLTPHVNYTINITISPTAVYDYSTVIVQAHTQKNVLKLSSQRMAAVNGSHVGLVELLTAGESRLQNYHIICYPHDNNKDKVDVLIAAQLLANEVPIPGGCSTVTPLEYDPNIYLSYDEYTTRWSFTDANLGFNADDPSSLLICDAAIYGYVPVKCLEYYTYIYYLPERSYSQSDMFDGIEKMLSSSRVTDHGDKSSTSLEYQMPKTVSYASTPGQGVVYNVIARDLLTGTISAYVPMVTYSCDFYAKIDGCDSLGSVINMSVGTVVGLLGLFLCLLGHRFFDFEMIILLIVIFSFVFFIVITRFSDWSHTSRVIVSIMLGTVTAIPFLMIWCFTGFYYPFVILFGMFMAFLLGSTLFYTPIGNLKYFKYNYVYGLGIACCTIIFVIPFVLFAKVLNITLCAVIGSYGVIFGISSFLRNSLSSIITDVLKHATVPGYSKDIETHPYQLTEIILTCLWGILVIGGIIVQLLLTRKRQKFPDSLYKRFKRWNSRRENNSINSRNNIRRAQESFHSSTTSGMENDERRRLLSFDSMPVSNYATITSNDVIK